MIRGDYPPALSYDMDVGFEQATFQRRMHREKFAAEDTATRNVIGSPGSEAWSVVVGTAGTTTFDGAGDDSDAFVVDWLFHDP